MTTRALIASSSMPTSETRTQASTTIPFVENAIDDFSQARRGIHFFNCHPIRPNKLSSCRTVSERTFSRIRIWCLSGHEINTGRTEVWINGISVKSREKSSVESLIIYLFDKLLKKWTAQIVFSAITRLWCLGFNKGKVFDTSWFRWKLGLPLVRDWRV